MSVHRFSLLQVALLASTSILVGACAASPVYTQTKAKATTPGPVPRDVFGNPVDIMPSAGGATQEQASLSAID